jgi:hypothetical protein
LKLTWKKGPGKVRTAKRGEDVAAADPAGSGKVYFSLLPQQSRYALPEPHGQGEFGFGFFAMVNYLHARLRLISREAIRIPSKANENFSKTKGFFVLMLCCK